MKAAAPADGAPHIGWARAIATGLLIVAVGFGLTVGVTNAVMTRLLGIDRDVRQWIATLVFLGVVVGIGLLLRRLQVRGVI